jgi:hypothetical protein
MAKRATTSPATTGQGAIRRQERGTAQALADLKPGQASIRMYRQGIGDCFLVRLPAKDGRKPFSLMIDCGAIDRTRDGAEFMQRVVQDIIHETGGVVDVLAVTHEHWDHVSGFTQARQLFSGQRGKGQPQLSAREVWCAWTEDPQDQLALVLKDGLRAARQKFADDVMRPKMPGAHGGKNNTSSQTIDELLGFYGLDTASLAANPLALAGQKDKKKTKAGNGEDIAKRASKTGAAFDVAKGIGPNLFRRPGELPIVLPGCDDVQVFILGPPRDPEALARTDPHGSGYHLAFAAGLALAGDPSGSRADSEEPFEASVPLDDAERQGDEAWEKLRLEMKDKGWRNLKSSETSDAAEFALMLDGATNNTSLVMAIELGMNGPVLLFVGDAQAGNWLSWDDHVWTLGERTVTAADLLARTVFYKVGHHGSHNATLREKGLDRMTRPDLVAFVPVDRAIARLKHWDRMPLPSIIEELRRKTRGRTELSEREPKPANEEDWTSKFGEALRIGPDKLWYEITVPL